MIIYAVTIGLIITGVFTFLIFRSLQQNKKATMIIKEQKMEVETQKRLVEDSRKEILDSIHYAQRIQKAHLPSDGYLNKNLGRLKNKR
jgi:hypothetical protein